MRTTQFYPFRVIFRTRRKKPRGVALIADIHTFAHIRKRFRSKGGRGHISLRIVQGQEGQAMAEYAVILAFVAAVLILVLSSLGGAVAQLFNEAVSQF
jgi:Flp pilus assembly pilin Flp